ncbi:CatA-like O-acetyltransferase [Myxococcota bacterium]|nr:CatA-like O-acetyltransferase [Myxococcota bacterium]
MRTIDLASWPRRPQYELYRACADPFYELTVRVSAPAVVEASRQAGWSVFAVVLAALTHAIQRCEPLRTRQRGEEVVVHDRIHPSWVVLGEGGRMSFARGQAHDELRDQLVAIEQTTAAARATPSLGEPHGRDDLFYASSLAPLDLVSVRPERSGLREDCVPRFFWGRVVEGRLHLTISAHHAFVDGMHLVGLVADLEEALRRPLPARPG